MSSNLIARSNFNHIGKLFRRLAVVCALAWPGAAHAGWTIVDFPRHDVTLRAVAVGGGSQAGRPVFAVSGSKGTFATSQDDGRTWRLAPVAGGEALDFRGVAMPYRNAPVLMSAGDGADGRARLYRSGNGGRTWKLVYETTEKGAFFDTISFDRNVGFVLGDPLDGRWFLLRTRDGGKTWSRIRAQGAAVAAGEAAFAASNSALFALGSQLWAAAGGGAAGRVFRSSDGGATWKVAETPIAGGPTGGVFGLRYLFQARRLIAVGGDHKDEQRAGPDVAVSDDGGATWSVAASAGRLIEGVGQLDARTLIAVGPRGTLVSGDLGLTWTVVDAEAFHAIACATRRCIAAGPNGRVAVWQD